MSAALKVGLIVDSESVDGYVHELVRWAATTESIRISHLLIQHRPRSPVPDHGVRRLLRVARKGPVHIATVVLWKLKQRAEARRVTACRGFEGFGRSFDIGKAVPGRIDLTPIVSRSGLVHRFSEEDLSSVRGEQFDLLLRCGSGILKGGILTSARLGILSFHHGDNRINRGGPAGFWEVHFGQARTGYIVQRLTEELDGGEVILRGYTPTQRTHLLNMATLFEKSFHHLRALLLRIAAAGELPPAEPRYPYSGKLYRAPTLGELATYLARIAQRSFRDRMRSMLRRRERWGIAFTRSDWAETVMRRGIRVEVPAGSFLADPFVVTRGGRTCVFAEEFRYDTSTGHIAAFELSESGAKALGAAVTERFHLSFPYLFEFGGGLYMCPESCAAREIRIYECTEFPLKWRLAIVAKRDVAAVDSMIFEESGTWWMLTNLSVSEPGACYTELHLFCAPTPLTDEWEPHGRNPILVDPHCARNGGLLRGAGGLFRVAQAQGFLCYGASAHLMRIRRIDREEYSEEPVCEIMPSFIAGIHGTHHMHSNGTYTVWDFKRWERIARAAPQLTEPAPRVRRWGQRAALR